MIDTALLLLLVLATGPLFIGLITLPRWYFRSVHRHYLWELRDEIVDDVLFGRLPADHPAVVQLVRGAEAAARHGKRMSIFEMAVYKTILHRERDAAMAVQAMTRMKALDRLNATQKELVNRYRGRLLTLFAGTMLLGSWLGLGAICGFVLAGIAGDVRRIASTRRIPARPAQALALSWEQAVEKVIAGTSLGRRTTEIARAETALSVLNA